MSYRSIRKNAEDFVLDDFYNKMTPDQFKKSLTIAIERTKKDMTEMYEKEIAKLTKYYEKEKRDITQMVIDTISVELLYELATQMNAFDETDEDIRSQIIEKVQEIYNNTMEHIKKYSKYKNDGQAHKEFLKKQKKIEKFFDIYFK